MVIILCRGDMCHNTCGGIASGMCQHRHGSCDDTSVSKPVFRADDTDDIKLCGTDSILFTHLFTQFDRTIQGYSFRHGNKDFFPRQRRVNRFACMRGDFFVKFLRKRLYTFSVLVAFATAFFSSTTGSSTSEGESKQTFK